MKINNLVLTSLDESEIKSINGGIIPLAVVAFCKGFAAGASVAGTIITAAKAIDKAIN